MVHILLEIYRADSLQKLAAKQKNDLTDQKALYNVNIVSKRINNVIRQKENYMAFDLVMKNKDIINTLMQNYQRD